MQSMTEALAYCEGLSDRCDDLKRKLKLNKEKFHQLLFSEDFDIDIDKHSDELAALEIEAYELCVAVNNLFGEYEFVDKKPD